MENDIERIKNLVKKMKTMNTSLIARAPRYCILSLFHRPC